MELNLEKHSLVFTIGDYFLGIPNYLDSLTVIYCFSTAEPKGSDCFEPFKVMQECMASYPTLYGNDDKKVEEGEEEEDEKATNQTGSTAEVPSSQDIART